MLTPIGDCVIVIRKKDDRTEGGIHIPDSAKRAENRGVVVAVGPGKFDAERDRFLPVCPAARGDRAMNGIQVNDTVVFNKHAGLEVEEDGEKFFLLNADDIVAVSHPAPAAAKKAA